MRRISETAKQTVIRLYINGFSLSSIAKTEKISRPTVKEILRKENIRNVYKKEIDHSDTVNENFFEKIDNEEKAYFLGLLYADGNIYLGNSKRKHHILSISLIEPDKYILETLRNLIAPNHKLYFRDRKRNKPNQKNQFILSISNKKLTNDLTMLGCTPRKSLTLTFPKNIPDNLLHHFIRGFFDGDGCISSYLVKRLNKNYYAYVNNFATTRSFCQSLGDIITSELNITYHLFTRKTNNITTELFIKGNRQVYRLMTWLYKDATIFLKRKHDKFLELEKQINQQNLKYARLSF